VDVQDGSVTGSHQAAPAIIALPEEIDIGNARQVGEQLRAAVLPGSAVLIADMTSTKFCDSAGLHQLLLASNAAGATGAELRFVIHSKAVLHIFQITGIDRLLLIYPSLQAALASAASPAAEVCLAREGCAGASRPIQADDFGVSAARPAGKCMLTPVVLTESEESHD
jgi:anti-sigma B factor antagonist